MLGARFKILVVIGTRPEAIKLFPVIHALRNEARIAVRVCVTGQHRHLTRPVLRDAGVSADYDLGLMHEAQGLDALTAALMVGIGRVIDLEAPDMVLVQGDTASATYGAMAAYHRRIPVAHVEAGLRSHDIGHPWPEEVNRRIVSLIAALHFAPTEAAAEMLRAERVDPATIHVTGNTIVDALHWIAFGDGGFDPSETILADQIARFAGKRIVAVTAHRRENAGQGIDAIATALVSLAERGDVGLILPLHPNPNLREQLRARLDGVANVALLEPLSHRAFLRLLDRAELVLTDSGGVQEEAPSFGTPVLVMRETTERREALTAGTARLVGLDAEAIVAEANLVLDNPDVRAVMSHPHNPFGDGRAAQRIAAVLRDLAA